MKQIKYLIPTDQHSIVMQNINEAELISGRTLPSEQKETMIRFFMDDLSNKFSWVTPLYLNQAIKNGLGTEFKYFDYKTLCKWLWEYKQSDEMRLKIALESPLVQIDTPEWETINWHMETNKAYHRFKTGGLSEFNINAAVYSRLFMDGFIEINAYHRYYKEPDGVSYDLEKVARAQRKIVLEAFQLFKDAGREYIYNPNQYFKKPLNENK